MPASRVLPAAEEDTAAAGAEAASHDSPIAGAAWCVLRRGDPEEEEKIAGCDVGVGLALARWRRLSWVAVLGVETLGTGLGWTAYRGGGGATVAVAAGFVVAYDSGGIDAHKVYPALGATLSLTEFLKRIGGGQ